MEKIRRGDAFLEGEAVGAGEPVLCIHGALTGADSFAPFLKQPALADSYRLIRYHRRGLVGSDPAGGPSSMSDQAGDASAVLDHFGVERAHVCGHSFGGQVALQLAIDAPKRVGTLALLEPSLRKGPSASSREELVGQLTALAEVFEAGDVETAALLFLSAVGGDDVRARVEAQLPEGWFDQVINDFGTFFESDFPAMATWEFGEAEAARITVPVLSVFGTESGPAMQEDSDWLVTHLGAESAAVSEATHMLQMADPVPVAASLARFLAEHPLD